MGLLFGVMATAQNDDSMTKSGVPTATQVLLGGVKSQKSRSAIKSVLMIQCRKDSAKGTGFAVRGGTIIITNSHVVGNCSAEELIGISPARNEPIRFKTMARDPNRDLALLCAVNPLPHSLELSGDETPAVETDVETWGYPLRYQESAPILSRGYVAGYTVKSGTSVKHLIVNGLSIQAIPAGHL
jgi:S1-C subfamily serine protease